MHGLCVPDSKPLLVGWNKMNYNEAVARKTKPLDNIILKTEILLSQYMKNSSYFPEWQVEGVACLVLVTEWKGKPHQLLTYCFHSKWRAKVSLERPDRIPEWMTPQRASTEQAVSTQPSKTFQGPASVFKHISISFQWLSYQAGEMELKSKSISLGNDPESMQWDMM